MGREWIGKEEGKRGDRRRGDRYLLLEFFKLAVFLGAIVFDFFLSFGAGVFDAFGTVCVVGEGLCQGCALYVGSALLEGKIRTFSG